jgi:bud emergence protein 1
MLVHSETVASLVVGSLPTMSSRPSSCFTHDSVASTPVIANVWRIVQALRRSIKGEKDKGPQISIAPKSAIAIVPPKKVCSRLH